MKDDSLKKVGVLCTYRFPEGMAPTARIISYGKGLTDNGVEVEVIIFMPKIQKNGDPLEGYVDGIHYIYSHERTSNASFIHKKLIDHPLSIIKTLRIIRQSNNQYPFDVILISFDNLLFMFSLIPFIWLMGIKMVFIGDEFPEPIRKLKLKIPKRQILLYKLIYKFISARVLMTETLRKFYDNIISFKPTYILCSILNTDRFENIKRQITPKPYLCYMGNMMIAKDNVDNIINAFHLIANRFPNLELHLYGTPDERDLAFIKKTIADCQLESKVLIKGRVDYSFVPQILANAQILVTSQPNTKRAAGGFPTKLAEYMMSHTPAVVTNVGEIHRYVTDRDTIFMVEPNNPQNYAKALEYVLTHPEEANLVAERAYQYAIENLSSKTVAQGLITFLSTL